MGSPTRTAAARACGVLALGAALAWAAAAGGAAAPGKRVLPKLGAELRLARSIRAVARARGAGAPGVPAPPAPLDLGDAAGDVAVLVGFADPPGAAALADLEARLGVRWHRAGGKLLFRGRVGGGVVPWDAIDALAAEPGVTRVELARRWAVRRPLDVSAPEIEATAAWPLATPGGHWLTGDGVLVADIDSGVDPFHPMFFRADAGRYAWIDVDASGRVTPGLDAVDLDGDGTADPDETLSLLDVTHYDIYGQQTTPPGLQPSTDYLFVDANGNGARDHGVGYGEDTPGLGEPLFVADDANEDGELTAGETLLMLGTPKIALAVNDAAFMFRRGLNLGAYAVSAEEEMHGTGVCGILAGGWPGIGRRLTGIAPGADLIVISSAAAGPAALFETMDLSFALGLAEAEGARITLHEYGWWAFDFLDGSGLSDALIDETTGRGMLNVTAAGNLAGGGKHARLELPAGGMASVPLAVGKTSGAPALIALTALWRTDPAARPTWTLAPPGSASPISLGNGGPPGTVSIGALDVFWQVDESPRGTARLDVVLSGSIAAGDWTLGVASDGPPQTLELFELDDVSTWGGGTVWAAATSDVSSVVFPATADDAFAVASYITRNPVVPGESIGGLSFFSGRGPTIAGRDAVDIAAPGHYDVDSAAAGADPFTGEERPYAATGWFGGTSAAAPHVAGAAAIVLGAYPGLDARALADALRGSAAVDDHTGLVPNDDWGWGKVRVRAALAAADPGDAPVLGGVALENAIAPEYVTVGVWSSEPLGEALDATAAGLSVDVDPRGAFAMSDVFLPAGATTLLLRAEDLAGNASMIEVALP